MEKYWHIPKLDKKQKQEFNLFFNRNAVPLIKFTLIIIIGASLFYYYLDFLSAPLHYKTFWLLRSLVLVITIFSFLFTFTKYIEKHLQIIAFIVSTAYNLAILAMIYMSNPQEISYSTYFNGLIMIFMTTVGLRLRLIPFLLHSLPILFLYLFIAITKQHLLEPENLKIFISNIFFLTTAILAVFIADFVLEVFTRKVFLQEKELREMNFEITQQKEEIALQRDQALEQKKKIEQQNILITQSINYAKGIQDTILPQENYIKQFFESFSLYLPRDIVSGDFYYFSKIDDKKFWIAVADCTGHGVPGALLSMIGYSYLNEIIMSNPNIEPKTVLEKLRVKVKDILHKNSKFDRRDGMDLAIVFINLQEKYLLFAGANNPIYISRKTKNVNLNENQKIRILKNNGITIIELKPDRMPIGLYTKEKPFSQIKFDLQDDDIIYLFSDGYTDQLSDSRKKFSTKNFKKLLAQIAEKPLEEQKQILIEKNLKWKGNEKQTDDILIIGIKIKL